VGPRGTATFAPFWWLYATKYEYCIMRLLWTVAPKIGRGPTLHSRHANYWFLIVQDKCPFRPIHSSLPHHCCRLLTVSRVYLLHVWATPFFKWLALKVQYTYNLNICRLIRTQIWHCEGRFGYTMYDRYIVSQDFFQNPQHVYLDLNSLRSSKTLRLVQFFIGTGWFISVWAECPKSKACTI